MKVEVLHLVYRTHLGDIFVQSTALTEAFKEVLGIDDLTSRDCPFEQVTLCYTYTTWEINGEAEMEQLQWEVERAEAEAGWDPNP